MSEWPPVGEERVERTRRWRGLAGAGLIALALGAGGGAPPLVVAGAVCVVLSAYAARVPAPAATLTVERHVRRDGDRPRVRLVVENTGSRPLPGVLVVDGVPPALSVIEGSPRRDALLRPGQRAVAEYTLEPAASDHEFDPVRIALRDPAGVVERRCRLQATGDDRARRRPDPAGASLPALRRAPPIQTGGTATAAGEGGATFDTVREYRPGDARSQVDWRRFARTGDLSTVVFREERATAVVLAVDARAAARVAPDATAPTAVERSVRGATALLAALDDGHRVGLTVLGGDTWHPPASGRAHETRLRHALATVPGTPRTNGERAPASALRTRLPGDAHVVLCSPLCDDESAAVARELAAAGWSTTVVSDDPTTAGTAGERLARAERTTRVRDLRRAGLQVVDWPRGVSLARHLEGRG